MAYLYRHIRKDLNQPFYIGIGSDANYNRAFDKHKRNSIWKRIVSKTEYEVEIMLDELSWEEVCKKEIEFIRFYGRKDNGTGILSNMTDGGEGSLNIVISKEARKAISERTSGIRNHNFGKKMSDEMKARISAKKKGIKMPEEFKIKIKNALNSFSVEKKAEISKKLSEVRKGRKFNDLHKKRIGDAQRGEKHHSAIKILDTETNKVYNTVLEASKDLNISKSNIYYWVTKQQRFIKI